jgi:hypothetical protein
MCLAVFLATEHELPIVAWSPDRPGFNAGPLERFEQSVRGKVSLPVVHSLGAHTGCGCGFLNDGAESPDDVRRSREALAAYAAAALRSGPVELYVCWNGNVEDGYYQQLTLAVDELTTRDDWLEEGTHVRIVPQAV